MKPLTFPQSVCTTALLLPETIAVSLVPVCANAGDRPAIKMVVNKSEHFIGIVLEILLRMDSSVYFINPFYL
jgi:hypothetical protein